MRRLTADRLESLDSPTLLGFAKPSPRPEESIAPDPGEVLRVRQAQALEEARKLVRRGVNRDAPLIEQLEVGRQ